MELKNNQRWENIDACKELLESMSDALWGSSETGYHEHFAARLYCHAGMLEKLGFQVEQDQRALKLHSLALMEAENLSLVSWANLMRCPV